MSVKYLTTLPDLDKLRSDRLEDTTRLQHQNVDLITTKNTYTDGGEQADATTNTSSETITTTAICHLAYFMPFTDGKGAPYKTVGTYQGAYAVALAAEHLNTGNGSIVQEVTNLNEQCNIRFTVELFDTEKQQRSAVEQVIKVTDRKEYLPCALLGGGYSSSSIPMSIISGLRGYPQLSGFSTSSDLDNVSQYPLFGRTIPSDDGTAIPLIRYFYEELNCRHLAVLYENDAYGSAYARGIAAVAEEIASDMVVKTFQIVENAGDDVIARTVRFLKDTQFTYFFGIPVSLDIFNKVMIECHKQEIAGTGIHNWFFSDSVGSMVVDEIYKRGSPLQLAYQGTSRLIASGGNSDLASYRKLKNSLQEIGTSEQDYGYIVDKMPRYYDADGNEEVEKRSVVQEQIWADRWHLLNDTGIVSTFLYDAAIAIGIAACDFERDGSVVDETTGLPFYFNGTAHFDAIVAKSFNGTSGSVIFNPDTGTRNPNSAYFSIDNFVYDEATEKFIEVRSGFYQNGEWNITAEYIFNDGTTNIPIDLPVPQVEENFLDDSLRGLGLAFSGLAILMSLGFAVWTQMYRSSRVVKASQPIFLHIICIGAATMASSIIPLSIDNGIASVNDCDIACISFPILLSVGFSVIFSALLSKTHRINVIFEKATQFKRAKVDARHVMRPLFVILGANLSIFVVWTILSPLSYNTVTVRTDSFDRPIETYGLCTSENQYYFLGTLLLINTCVLGFSIREARKVKNLSTEFHESKNIFMVMVLILLACFIGVPVIVIARENPAAYYFVFIGIIFAVSISVLLLIFLPKIKAKNKPQVRRRSSVRNSSSHFSSRSSSHLEDCEGIRVLACQQTRHSQLHVENEQLKRELELLQQRIQVEDEGKENFDGLSSLNNTALRRLSTNTNSVSFQLHGDASNGGERRRSTSTSPSSSLHRKEPNGDVEHAIEIKMNVDSIKSTPQSVDGTVKALESSDDAHDNDQEERLSHFPEQMDSIPSLCG